MATNPTTIAFPPDLTEEDRKIIARVLPYTMTSLDRIISLINAVRFIARSRIPGDIAECGVWKGGSMMAVAITLAAERDTTRRLYLYDTFAGMDEPGPNDRSFDGVLASEHLSRVPRGTGAWCYSHLEEVKANLAATGYPEDRMHFIQGKVEETIPGTMPAALALLRLDTDWYESTRHELVHLYPILCRRGILIIDDYGHWQGAKKATDEFFAGLGQPVFLQRIDYTGRLLLKE